MTFDVFVRFIMLPAIATAALYAIVVTLREEIQDWRRGGW
jgi:hypothetical protein